MTDTTRTRRAAALLLLLLQACDPTPDTIESNTPAEPSSLSDHAEPAEERRDTANVDRELGTGGSLVFSEDTYKNIKDLEKRAALKQECEDPIKDPLREWAKPHGLKVSLANPDDPWPIYEIHLSAADVRGTIFVEIDHFFRDPPALIVRHNTSVADPARFDLIRKNVQERYDLAELADMIAGRVAECAARTQDR